MSEVEYTEEEEQAKEGEEQAKEGEEGGEEGEEECKEEEQDNHVRSSQMKCELLSLTMSLSMECQ